MDEQFDYAIDRLSDEEMQPFYMLASLCASEENLEARLVGLC